MQEILVLGAGKIGALISGLLAESGDYNVQLADSATGAADVVVKAAQRRETTHWYQTTGVVSNNQ